MEDYEAIDIDKSEEVGHFTEAYSSFNKIINRIQRQYLSLKEVYTRQSEQLQSVNEHLQSLIEKNRMVTEFLDSILNSISSGVIAIDRGGYVTHINPAARNILGIAESYKNSQNPKYEEIIEAIAMADNSALETVRSGRVLNNVEKRIKTRHNTVLILSVSTSLLRNNDGETVGAVELFYDITRIRQMEEQLSQMKILASLGEMAASIAHEIRNPLGGVGGFASLLVRDLSHNPPQKAMAEKIVSGVASINRTIETLLDFARHEEVHKTTVNLGEYLTDIIGDFHDEYGHCSQSENIIPDISGQDKIKVELDSQLFKRAIYNLMKNGLEAGREDSQVIIKCRRLSQGEARADFGDKLDFSGWDTLAEIEIADNGSGIEAEDMGRIFSPFFSTKQNGTGLGLSIAWKIIKAHGGDIRVESEVGQGTRFFIVLPAWPAGKSEGI
jgi:PAS domain S-box-containing protein